MIDSLSRGRGWGTALAIILVTCGTLAAVPLRPLRKPIRPPITVANAAQVKELTQFADDVWRIVWSRNGRELALVRWEKPVDIVDGTTFRPIRTLGSGKKIIHFDFHPDPKIVTFCENAMHAEILRMDTGNTIRIDDGHQQPAMKFSPDGKLLATGGYGNAAKLWSVPDGKLLRILNIGDTKGGLTVEFSPDGKVLAVGNRNAHTCLFDAATGKLLRTLDRKMSHGLRFDPAGNVLAVVYVDGTFSLWEIATGKELHSVKTPTELYCVDWTQNGEVLVTSGVQTSVTLWSARNLSKLKQLSAGGWVIQARFSPDGSRLVTADQQRGGERHLRVWGLPGDFVEFFNK
jgi:WD40 repeat protein